MVDNPPSEVTPGQGPSMQVGFGATVDPMGNGWVTVTLGNGVLQQQFSIPASNADEFADHIKATGRDARRKATGLVLPSDTATRPVLNGNMAH